MSIDDKLKDLEELISKIEVCLKCYNKYKNWNDKERIKLREWCNEGPWFFPPYEESGVKGFFGTGNVIFVCQRPSTQGGKFKEHRDTLEFYKLLKKYGFQEAHITDLVKCKSSAGEIKDEEIENCFPFLEEEIRILKPKLIVAVGEKVHEVLKKKEIKDIRLKKIMHYSYAFRYKKEKKLEEEFNELAKEIEKELIKNNLK
jgi:hypothetical protein